jgi:hypothetical protein
MLEHYLTNNSIVHQDGVEFYICNVVAKKMYSINHEYKTYKYI